MDRETRQRESCPNQRGSRPVWGFPATSPPPKVEQVAPCSRASAPLVCVMEGELNDRAELEVSLHMAFVEARQKRHEFITVEHLLPCSRQPVGCRGVAALPVRASRSCGAISTSSPGNARRQSAGEDEIDTQPTLGFQRVIQRAILHAVFRQQSTGAQRAGGDLRREAIRTRCISCTSRA